MIYWVTGNITSSIRLYYENRKTVERTGGFIIDYLSNPTGCAIFPREIISAPKSWAKWYYNLKHWSVMSSGGHFAAMEEPVLLAQDIFHFSEKIQK